ncbi:TPA: class I SAM-dependent methyltransferase [Elizabethkingia anophelis]|nr:class I SAM-dependent methyltransferase [Elizabethkingia anophelis]HBN6702678.1 class I SAM-dependent methyltransferase [Elizabethkingia anophelis]HBN6707329.1 class I SAM-dependent methyltransferase [Elizabethkingia anophelis]HBN6711363.1 class I SAM-dependent methyltransferase [Elizabethkingia anophelis]HBN6714149.1 class I SAM-dependent methyltransferase [Elizabethkingia anophelis]
MDWFESWFNTPYYHILYKDRDFVEAENFIDKLLAEIRLPQHSTIIDLACGHGRHSVYLNQKGYTVLGLDLSEASISFDKQFENDTLSFRVHDMRNPIQGEKVDAVMNLFTSFGYFDQDDDDEKVFESVAQALKLGGLFVLDFLNADYVEHTLVPESLIVKDNISFSIHKKIDNKRVIKDIRFSDNGQDFHYEEKVKLHSFEKLKSLAEKHQLSYVTRWGDYQLGLFSDNSPRCIILFQKK